MAGLAKDSSFVLLKSPDGRIARTDIDISLRGAVVAAGHCSDPDVLRYGAELPLRGLILTSMTAQIYPGCQQRQLSWRLSF